MVLKAAPVARQLALAKALGKETGLKSPRVSLFTTAKSPASQPREFLISSASAAAVANADASATSRALKRFPDVRTRRAIVRHARTPARPEADRASCWRPTSARAPGQNPAAVARFSPRPVHQYDLEPRRHSMRRRHGCSSHPRWRTPLRRGHRGWPSADGYTRHDEVWERIGWHAPDPPGIGLQLRGRHG